jgi:hypothetical protein
LRNIGKRGNQMVRVFGATVFRQQQAALENGRKAGFQFPYFHPVERHSLNTEFAAHALRHRRALG